MPFNDVYEAVQKLPGKISTNDIRALCTEHSDIKTVRETWSNVLDQVSIRGFYIEGPFKGPLQIGENQALIVLSRSMCNEKPTGKHWRRFVLTKELMHVFDTEGEKAQNQEQFDLQIERIINPLKPFNPQHNAELKAEWRAVGVLCRETDRLALRDQLARRDISPEVAAASLQIPLAALSTMMRADFEEVFGNLRK